MQTTQQYSSPRTTRSPYPLPKPTPYPLPKPRPYPLPQHYNISDYDLSNNVHNADEGMRLLPPFEYVTSPPPRDTFVDLPERRCEIYASRNKERALAHLSSPGSHRGIHVPPRASKNDTMPLYSHGAPLPTTPHANYVQLPVSHSSHGSSQETRTNPPKWITATTSVKPCCGWEGSCKTPMAITQSESTIQNHILRHAERSNVVFKPPNQSSNSTTKKGKFYVCQISNMERNEEGMLTKRSSTNLCGAEVHLQDVVKHTQAHIRNGGVYPIFF